MKKFIILFCSIIVLVVCNTIPISVVYADNDVEKELTDSVEEQVDSIDWTNLDKLLDSLSKDNTLFGTTSFKDKVASILSGKYFDNYDNLFSAILGFIWSEISSFLPLLLIIICVAILGSIASSFKPNVSSNGVNDVIHFVCYALVIMLVAISFKTIISLVSGTLNNMKTQMAVIFPILFTLLTAIGSVSSVAIYKPLVAVLSNVVTSIFTNVIFPMFMLSFIFVIIGQLTKTVKLDKINEFLGSVFKWIVGGVFTIFSGFLAIQGISAGKYDNLSVKLTKFTVKSYVPIIGSYISDGMDMIILSSILIKNAIGVTGLLLLFSTILLPILKIVVFKLGLKLAGGIIEPIGDSRISNYVDKCSKILIYPIVMILGVAFMYILTIGLMMCTVSVV